MEPMEPIITKNTKILIKELDIRKYLKKYTGIEVDFYRFNGNYGDSLIWHGTMKLLNDFNITVNYVDLNSKIKNKVLFIDGGGNLVDYYSDVMDFLKNKHKMYKNIVILPHTINGKKVKNILSKLGSNCTIFCREEISYKFVTKCFTAGKVYLWHDNAFYNDLSNYIKNGRGILNVFRGDCESIKIMLSKDNVDISAKGWCKKPLKQFLNKINKYSEIRTDRLHIAIAAVLLQKKVLFFPNSYYKNLAVYNYSLKTKYSNITFVYVSDKKLINQKDISKVFSNFHNSNIKHQNLLNLFSEIININYNLWKLEDVVRDVDIDYKTRVNIKNNIDRVNQLRNDTITKIDINFSLLLNNTEKGMKQFVSESPGSLIDRLSIFYIKKYELKRILKLMVDDSILMVLYKEKATNVDKQIKYLELYLKNFVKNIKCKKAFFKVFEPIKIYNDPRVKKYIKQRLKFYD